MSKKIAKVQVTSGIGNWWESDLSDIFLHPDKIEIISALEYDGGLYLIYLYDADDDIHKKTNQ